MSQVSADNNEGTTLTTAIIKPSGTLEIANVGDTVAILVNNDHVTIASSEHHITNLDEMSRLIDMGFNKDRLEKTGRMGPYENTRSIGDKIGKTDLSLFNPELMPGKTLSSSPLIATPTLFTTADIPNMLVIATDGVSNALSNIFEFQSDVIPNEKEVHDNLVQRINTNLKKYTLDVPEYAKKIAEEILAQIYSEWAASIQAYLKKKNKLQMVLMI